MKLSEICHRRVLAGLPTIGIALGLAQGAGAAEPSNTSDQIVPEEIIVTASKRSETVQKAVGSISALTAGQMATQGIHTLDDVSQHIAGMTFYTVSGTAFMTMRGVGVPVDTGASDPNTAINIDGVNLPRTSEGTLNSYDMERVEVARGPQGTLYGRNATGGAVNFITIKPEDSLSGEVGGGIGNYMRTDLHGYVTGPLGENVRGLISTSFTDQTEGFVKNLYTGGSLDRDSTFSIRGALSADVTDNLKVDLSAMHEYEKYNQYQQLMGGQLQACLGGPGACGTASLTTIPGLLYSLQPWELYSSYVRPSEKNTEIYIGTINWDILDNLHLRSITGGVMHTNDKGLDGLEVVPTGEILPSVLDHTPFAYFEPSRYLSQELDLSGTFGNRGSWVVGLFLSQEHYQIDIPIYLPNFGANFDNPNPSNPLAGTNFGINYNGYFRETTKALFADATVPITDDLRVLGGVRVAREENDTDQAVQTGIFPASPLSPAGATITNDGCGFLTGGAIHDANYNLKWTPVTPRAGVQYDVTDKINTYFTWSRGFKDGGTSPTACGNTYKPEILTSYEIGIKSRLFDDRLTLNLSAFHYEYNNSQVYEGIGPATSIVANADAVLNGVDIDAVADLPYNLSVDVAASAIDSYYTNFYSDDASDPLNTRHLPTAVVGGKTLVNLKGFAVQGVPDYNITAGLQEQASVNLPFFDKLLVRVEGNFVGQTHILPWGRTETIQQPFAKLNYVIQLTNADGWSLRAYGRNMTNVASTYHFLFNGGANTWNGQYAPPRTFGFELAKTFGS